MHIYFAAPLFSKADACYNASVVENLRETYPTSTIYLPQENEAINDKEAYADSQMIALADTNEVKKSDLLIAVLDGLAIDPGVASEIGVAYALGIPILGLYTDVRQQGATNKQKIQALSVGGENQFHYVNLYTVGLIKLNGALYASEEDLLTGLNKFMKDPVIKDDNL